MRRGERGRAVRQAPRFQIEVGNLFEAERFVRVNHAHVMATLQSGPWPPLIDCTRQLFHKLIGNGAAILGELDLDDGAEIHVPDLVFVAATVLEGDRVFAFLI